MTEVEVIKYFPPMKSSYRRQDSKSGPCGIWAESLPNGPIYIGYKPTMEFNNEKSELHYY